MSGLYLRNLSKRMTSEIIKRFTERADEAEAMVKSLRSKISVIRTNVQNNLFKEEESRLRKGNEKFLNEIQTLKERLTAVEQQNGRVSAIKTNHIDLTNVSGEVKIDSSSSRTDTISKKPEAQPKTSKPPKEKKEKKEKNSKKPADEDIPVDIRRLDLRVGKIVSVEKHPDADSLYVEQIDVGEQNPRTVVSGLVKFIPIEEMTNRMVVLMCNLKPAKMRGVVSQAMVMCASTPDKVEILTPPTGSMPGELIEFEGFPCGVADAQLNPKKKIWEQVAPDLKTSDDFVATYKGIPFTVSGKGVVQAQTLKNVIIK